MTDLRETELTYQQALEREPDNAAMRAGFGLFLAQSGRFREALPHMRQSVLLAPEVAAYWTNYGNVLRRLGQIDDAIVAFENAVDRDDGDAVAENCLGDAWQAKGLLPQAIERFQAAVAKRKDYGLAWGNLGIALSRVGRLSESAAAFAKALALQPDNASHHGSLGSLLRDSCRLDEALEHFAKALELAPQDARNVSKYLYTLNFSPKLGSEQVQMEHAKWASRISGAEALQRRPSRGQTVRLGFLSGDFSSHSVAFFLLPLMRHLDRSRFEICCISETAGGDAVTRSFREFSRIWIDSIGRPAEEVAREVDSAEIDVLIDLAGHTAGARLDILAASSAPVKLTWLGYPHRLGLPWLDGRIVDEVTDPEEGEGEPLLRLPDCFVCYEAGEQAPEARPLPALENGYVTFGSFNNAAKLNESVLELWAEVLQAVPASRLFLKSWQFADADLRSRIADKFAGWGVERERLEFRARVDSYADHLAMYGEIDIALDTFPYNGTTTTCEAMRMGVPTVVLAGDRHASRVGASLLRAARMKDWIASDKSEYLTLARTRAANLTALAALRRVLPGCMSGSTLCDGPGFAGRFAALLEEVIERKGGGEMKEWIERIEFAEGATDGEIDHKLAVAALPDRLDGLRILDASCLDGFWAIEVLRRGARQAICLPAEGFFEVAGDGGMRLPREEFFVDCRSRLGVEADRMQLLSGQVYHLSAEDVGSFDWVILAVNASRLRHLTFALDALRGVCGGKLLLSMELADGDPEQSAVFLEEGPIWLPTKKGLIDLLALSGFEVETLDIHGKLAVVVARTA